MDAPSEDRAAQDMEGRVVLVTGGTRGLGAEISAAFAARGATVVVCGRTEPEAKPDAPAFFAVDVRDPEAVAALVEQVAERYGRLDIVVNNAGGSPPADAATASPRFTEAIVKLNLLGPLAVAEAANSVMQQQSDGGCIIHIGSQSGMRPSPGTAAYGAAKAGLIEATRAQAEEWAPKVRVNAVTPGAIGTEEFLANYSEEYLAKLSATIPMGRIATPAEVASACCFLASDEASYITGANLLVHGGGDVTPNAALV